MKLLERKDATTYEKELRFEKVDEYIENWKHLLNEWEEYGYLWFIGDGSCINSFLLKHGIIRRFKVNENGVPINEKIYTRISDGKIASKQKVDKLLKQYEDEYEEGEYDEEDTDTTSISSDEEPGVQSNVSNIGDDEEELGKDKEKKEDEDKGDEEEDEDDEEEVNTFMNEEEDEDTFKDDEEEDEDTFMDEKEETEEDTFMNTQNDITINNKETDTPQINIDDDNNKSWWDRLKERILPQQHSSSPQYTFSNKRQRQREDSSTDYPRIKKRRAGMKKRSTIKKA